jgi:hypothetical protein
MNVTSHLTGTLTNLLAQKQVTVFTSFGIHPYFEGFIHSSCLLRLQTLLLVNLRSILVVKKVKTLLFC